MEVIASLQSYRQSPRKVRLIATAIRGKRVSDAVTELDFMVKRGATPMKKLLMSAIANAEHNFKLDKSTMVVKNVTVDGGVTMKRSMPRAFGRAYPIHKRTSHITIVLDEGVVKAKKTKVALGRAASKTGPEAVRPSTK